MVNSTHKLLLETLLEKCCSHNDITCCCNMIVKETSGNLDVSEEVFGSKLDEGEVFSPRTKNNKLRYFCNICVRHGGPNKGKSFRNGSDWVVNGAYFGNN